MDSCGFHVFAMEWRGLLQIPMFTKTSTRGFVRIPNFQHHMERFAANPMFTTRNCRGFLQKASISNLEYHGLLNILTFTPKKNCRRFLRNPNFKHRTARIAADSFPSKTNCRGILRIPSFKRRVARVAADSLVYYKMLRIPADS